MYTAEQLRAQREVGLQAEMQKLFVKGHLLIGADVSAVHISDFLTKLGEVCGMNIFNGPHVKTPDSYDPETYCRLGNRPPEDINGSVMWDDSGAQLYIFPNRGNWFTLDVYTCKRFNEREALLYTYEELGANEDMAFSSSTAEINTPWSQFVLADRKPLNPESKFLPAIDRLFDDNHEDPDQILRTGLSLRNTLVQATREGCGNRVAQSYTKEQIKRIQEMYGKYEVAVDHQFIEDILTGKAVTPDQYPLQTIYDKLSLMEASQSGIQRGVPIVHIGTGWPGTAIGLYRQFGIPVTCIEKDPDFADKSQEGLSKLGLLGKDRLQVICADGINITTRGFQAVIISAMIPNEDKERIVKNMRELMLGDKSDPLLILRTSANTAMRLFYQNLPAEIQNSPWLTKIGDTQHMLGFDDPIRSLVFRVGAMAEIRRGFDDRLLATEAVLMPLVA